jgi:predicted 3-demethylubiquinone-9 3-methyltransferase (glyoxalase superfamily)
MMNLKQKIIPNLWFDRQAEEAAHFYTDTFKNSAVGNVTRASKAGYEVHGLREGTVMNIEFEIEGMRFIGINGGPIFKFNPAISFLVACATKNEVEQLWKALSQGGGPALMDLGVYPFSERYGWTQDRYGLSWQIMFMGNRPINQKIIPTLMFVKEQWGKTEEAVNLYTSIFRGSKIGEIMRYGKGEEPDKEGTVKHAGFTLKGQDFAAMDSAHKHDFSFNEAVSLMVECRTQAEIDYYWRGLTANGGQESVCGWLKDRFGVSWQVAPAILGKMLRDRDQEKVERVTNAFLKMTKFDISALKRACAGMEKNLSQK